MIKNKVKRVNHHRISNNQMSRKHQKENIPPSSINKYLTWCRHFNYRLNLVINLQPHHMETMHLVMTWKSFKHHVNIIRMHLGLLMFKIWIKISGKLLAKLIGVIHQ